MMKKEGDVYKHVLWCEVVDNKKICNSLEFENSFDSLTFNKKIMRNKDGYFISTDVCSEKNSHAN